MSWNGRMGENLEGCLLMARLRVMASWLIRRESNKNVFGKIIELLGKLRNNKIER